MEPVQHYQILRALVAAQVALIDHERDPASERGPNKRVLLLCLKEATNLAKKLEG
jgi:hypothetical protein